MPGGVSDSNPFRPRAQGAGVWRYIVVPAVSPRRRRHGVRGEPVAGVVTGGPTGILPGGWAGGM